MRTARAFSVDPNSRGARNSRWPGRTLAERFWTHVDKSGECWIWTGHLNQRGYGKFGHISARCALAHRVSFAMERGPIPAKALVLHSRECVSRACVRPDHLRLGDQLENMADRRVTTPRSKRAETCGRGHRFTPENTMKEGKNRRCRECKRIKDRRNWPAKAARARARAAFVSARSALSQQREAPNV